MVSVFDGVLLCCLAFDTHEIKDTLKSSSFHRQTWHGVADSIPLDWMVLVTRCCVQLLVFNRIPLKMNIRSKRSVVYLYNVEILYRQIKRTKVAVVPLNSISTKSSKEARPNVNWRRNNLSAEHILIYSIHTPTHTTLTLTQYTIASMQREKEIFDFGPNAISLTMSWGYSCRVFLIVVLQQK